MLCDARARVCVRHTSVIEKEKPHTHEHKQANKRQISVNVWMTIIGVSMASIKTEICSIIYLKWTIRNGICFTRKIGRRMSKRIFPGWTHKKTRNVETTDHFIFVLFCFPFFLTFCTCLHQNSNFIDLVYWIHIWFCLPFHSFKTK